jgi:hypothetical protein
MGETKAGGEGIEKGPSMPEPARCGEATAGPGCASAKGTAAYSNHASPSPARQWENAISPRRAPRPGRVTFPASVGLRAAKVLSLPSSDTASETFPVPSRKSPNPHANSPSD